MKSANEYDKELFNNCLRRFSYTRCYNSFQFLATLKTLKNLLQNKKENQYMLIIDSAGPFYWMDHALAVPSSLEFSSIRKKISPHNVAETVVQEITKLKLAYSIVVLASASVAVGDKTRSWEGDADLRNRDRMPSVWKSLLSHRVLVYPRGDECSFVTEWVLPPTKFSDKFSIAEDGSLSCTRLEP